MIKISVIVCIYNAEKYIEKCINSILNQTYEDYELIIVNDGSFDGSMRICHELCDGNSRVKFIDKTNGGLVSARKSGVSASDGEYICCIDADDWIEEDYLEKLIGLQEESNADTVAAGHYREIGSSCKKVCNHISQGIYKASDVIGRMMFSGTFYIPGILQYFHGKLIRTSILKSVQNIVDERISVGEDVAVIYPAIAKSNTICISDYCGYHYVSNNSSMVATVGENEYEKLNILVEYLQEYFMNTEYYDLMMNQIDMFRKSSLLTRCIEYTDMFVYGEDDESVLFAFGGIPRNSRVVIYGAGIFGQRVRNYCVANDFLELVRWVDKEYNQYKSMGMDVESPDVIQELNCGEYDYIIVAIINANIVDIIKKYLMGQCGVERNKILWLSKYCEY